MVKRATKQKRIEEDSIIENEVVEHASDSDEAPEEESNASRRKSIKGLDKSRKSEQKRKVKAPKADKKVEVATDLAQEDAEKEKDMDDEAANTKESGAISSTPSAPHKVEAESSLSHRLDPALFAASFSKRRSNGVGGLKKLDGEGETFEPSKKRRGGSIAKGRDGQPMKRLKDGRTTVRVLPKMTSLSQEAEGRNTEERYAEPASLDPTEVMPTAKARAFRKQKLQLRDRDEQATLPSQKKDKVTLPVRTADDPLGLQDPAFMKGGEFARLGTGKKAAPKAAPSVPRGKRGRFSPAMSRHGQALHFARSL